MDFLLRIFLTHILPEKYPGKRAAFQTYLMEFSRLRNNMRGSGCGWCGGGGGGGGVTNMQYWVQRTTQRRIKLLDLSVAGYLVKEMLVPDVTLSADKTKLIARLVLRQKGKIYWPIFQLAELVFFRASTMRN